MSVCPVGYFGQDCSETCINSYTCDGCNDASGSCDYGCRPGWIGYFCQKNFKQGLIMGASYLNKCISSSLKETAKSSPIGIRV
uniref:Multiple epidermal growth factor-like domains 6 n=1 Tax=Magallana gigas TaxID=29159 RepID=K1P747_MAGGI